MANDSKNINSKGFMNEDNKINFCYNKGNKINYNLTQSQQDFINAVNDLHYTIDKLNI